MKYKRNILPEIENQIFSKEIIVLTGMRRVGKTTLLKMIYDKIDSENKVFFDLENLLEQRIFEEIDYNNVWANLKNYGITKERKAYIFIDEIQIKPEITKVIKYMYHHYDVKFFITGSSSFYLKNLFPESLAGRKIIFELYPLDFHEFLVFKEQGIIFFHKFSEKEKNKNLIAYEKYKKYFFEYLTYGGFPQVVLEDDIKQKEYYLKDIFNSYFEKELRNLSDFRNLSAFRDLLILLIQRTGSKLEVSKLASQVGISRETVYSYISFLQGTFFLFLISPFSTNVDREISGARKIYFCDTGIINLLGKIPEGNLLENACFNNLLKYGKINYYQKRTGAEIDFILNDKEIALEIKTKGNLNDYKKLSKLANGLSINDSYIISQSFSDENGIIPVTEL